MTPPYNCEKSNNEYHKDGEKQSVAPENDPSNRPSSRSVFESPEAAKLGTVSASKGAGSIPLTGIAPTRAARDIHYKNTRLSRAQLEQIEARLTARDHAVLHS